jgi:hypothetical protein
MWRPLSLSLFLVAPSRHPGPPPVPIVRCAGSRLLQMTTLCHVPSYFFMIAMLHDTLSGTTGLLIVGSSESRHWLCCDARRSTFNVPRPRRSRNDAPGAVVIFVGYQTCLQAAHAQSDEAAHPCSQRRSLLSVCLLSLTDVLEAPPQHNLLDFSYSQATESQPTATGSPVVTWPYPRGALHCDHRFVPGRSQSGRKAICSAARRLLARLC